MYNLFRIDVVDGIPNWKVPKAEGRGREAEQKAWVRWDTLVTHVFSPQKQKVHVAYPFCLSVEKRKEAHGDSLDRQQKKKIEREEERLKNNNRDLSLVKMKSMFAIGFAFTALLSMFNNIFDGRVVARLPFVPISWIQGLSHRNLPGDDYTECSFIFLYILCTMSIRQVSERRLSRGGQAQICFVRFSFLEHPENARLCALQNCQQAEWQYLWTTASAI